MSWSVPGGLSIKQIWVYSLFFFEINQIWGSMKLLDLRKQIVKTDIASFHGKI